MDIKLIESWQKVLSKEFEQNYFKDLIYFLKGEYAKNEVYPKHENIFRALNLCPLENVKVVIIGQDPYHTPEMADGLCFSVPAHIKKLPPSLKNIITELNTDLGNEIMTSGDLSYLAKQGVLLLNTVLTVRKGEADSHSNQGWEEFTSAILRELSSRKKELVYILWGAKAKKKASMVNPNENLILYAPHPSPLSSYRGFFGSKPFSAANKYLLDKGHDKIEW